MSLGMKKMFWNHISLAKLNGGGGEDSKSLFEAQFKINYIQIVRFIKPNDAKLNKIGCHKSCFQSIMINTFLSLQ